MNQQNALAQAIVLTDQILEVLEDGEFDRVRELEAIRDPYIKQAFIDSIEEIDLIKAQHLKNLNQQVVDKLNLFRQQVMQQQARLRTATKAAHAYRSNDSVPK
ncbi:MAG: hypothetical protein OEO19_20070 [Gammaproteobacteria bacterium]|nr:hypothetical protein [Gammaproteobacteria bacterium]MDH3448878.1 hypothetical protein [Gammaproteobacteria bacterium]